MKLLSYIKQVFLITSITIASVVGITSSFSCDDPCETLALADLTIPVIVDAFDQLGNPIIDPVTGQRIQALNELFYNQRTGEYFNSDNPPSQGLLVGDVIQMATNVYNAFSESKCELGAGAAPTATDAKLNVSGSPFPELNGTYQLGSMPTPFIPYNSNGFTATAFSLQTPGYYSVDMNANVDRTVEEHSYNNNFYVGDQGSYSRGNTFVFYVEENPNKKVFVTSRKLKMDDLAPKTVDELKNLEVYNFITSEKYTQWIIEKYSSK